MLVRASELPSALLFLPTTCTQLSRCWWKSLCCRLKTCTFCAPVTNKQVYPNLEFGVSFFPKEFWPSWPTPGAAVTVLSAAPSSLHCSVLPIAQLTALLPLPFLCAGWVFLDFSGGGGFHSLILNVSVSLRDLSHIITVLVVFPTDVLQ